MAGILVTHTLRGDGSAVDAALHTWRDAAAPQRRIKPFLAPCCVVVFGSAQARAASERRSRCGAAAAPRAIGRIAADEHSCPAALAHPRRCVLVGAHGWPVAQHRRRLPVRRQLSCSPGAHRSRCLSADDRQRRTLPPAAPSAPAEAGVQRRAGRPAAPRSDRSIRTTPAARWTSGSARAAAFGMPDLDTPWCEAASGGTRRDPTTCSA